MSADLLPHLGRVIEAPLSRDPKCGVCGCAIHVLRCDSHGCECDRPPTPGIQNARQGD